MHQQFSYEEVLSSAERYAWRVDDLIGGDKQLDFAKPFLPETLARTRELNFLDRDEQRNVNQIRSHGYLYTFGLVEEFILPFVLDHVRSRLDGNDYRVRAMLSFAAEEAKHIQLFKRFRGEFENGFGCAQSSGRPTRSPARCCRTIHCRSRW